MLVLLKHVDIRASDGEVAIYSILDACMKVQSLVITRALMGGRMRGRPELLPVMCPPRYFRLSSLYFIILKHTTTQELIVSFNITMNKYTPNKFHLMFMLLYVPMNEVSTRWLTTVQAAVRMFSFSLLR